MFGVDVWWCTFFIVLGQPELITKEDLHYSDEEDKLVVVPESEGEDNLTVAHHEENPTEEQRVHSVPDVSVEEDGGRFNKNKENQLSDDIQKVPQPALDNPLEMGLGVEVEHSHSGQWAFFLDLLLFCLGQTIVNIVSLFWAYWTGLNSTFQHKSSV